MNKVRNNDDLREIENGGGDELTTRTYVTEIGPHDVLLGRGTGPCSNRGNVQFRHIVRKMKAEYVSTASRKTKNKLILKTIQVIKAKNGRFLSKLSKGETEVLGLGCREAYQIIPDSMAAEKTKQAIRYFHYRKNAPEKTESGADTKGSFEEDEGSEGNSGEREQDQQRLLGSAGIERIPRESTAGGGGEGVNCGKRTGTEQNNTAGSFLERAAGNHPTDHALNQIPRSGGTSLSALLGVVTMSDQLQRPIQQQQVLNNFASILQQEQGRNTATTLPDMIAAALPSSGGTISPSLAALRPTAARTAANMPSQVANRQMPPQAPPPPQASPREMNVLSPLSGRWLSSLTSFGGGSDAVLAAAGVPAKFLQQLQHEANLEALSGSQLLPASSLTNLPSVWERSTCGQDSSLINNVMPSQYNAQREERIRHALLLLENSRRPSFQLPVGLRAPSPPDPLHR